MKKLNISMNKKKAARESIINDIIDQNNLRKFTLGNTSDDKDVQKLFSEIYHYFAKKLTLDSSEVEAWNRMLTSINRNEKMDAAYHRNNIFKAAHALGMKLPSMMF